MDQIKIGKYISKKRKERNITQSKLAERLNITDRAISKWENGNCMPDIGIIPELCDILDISINDLFSGEDIDMKEFEKKANENLLDLATKEELQNKKMIVYEYTIGIVTLIAFLALLFIGVSPTVDISETLRCVIVVLAFILFIVGESIALKIEAETGYYECKKCHHKYIPGYKKVFFAPHIGMKRYMKCPKCNERSWQKKVMK